MPRPAVRLDEPKSVGHLCGVKSLAVLLAIAFAAGGCGDDQGAPSSETGSTSSAGGSTASSSSGSIGGGGASSASTGGGGASGCHAELGPADADRLVVVGHPYDAMGNAAQSYEVLTLKQDETLAQTGTKFDMGRPADAPIVFTPDGTLGFAVEDDGTIGEFRVEDDGSITVLETSYKGSFYADRLVVAAAGGTLFVIDPDFPDSGGGIYEVLVGCDGKLTDRGRLFPTKNARGFAFDPATGDMLIGARQALGSTGIAHAHRVHANALQASVDVFGDDDAILSWMTLTHGAKHLLLGDNSAFASSPNRVGAVPLTSDGFGAPQILTGIEDPYAIAASPFDDAVIVVSGFGDAIFVLDYDPSAAAPLSLRGELPYVAGSPQVPGALTMIERGKLSGRVLVADVRGVFVVQFAPSATVTDQGVFDLGGGTENVVAGIGAQP